jgi:hypothetical protein
MRKRWNAFSKWFLAIFAGEPPTVEAHPIVLWRPPVDFQIKPPPVPVCEVKVDHALDMAGRSLLEWKGENDEVKLLSISLWTEGSKCEHTYKRIPTSKLHKASVKMSGTHKDYLCTKCGHSYCGVVSDDTKAVAKEWTAMLAEPKKGDEAI